MTKTIEVDDELYDILKELSDDLDTSMSDIIKVTATIAVRLGKQEQVDALVGDVGLGKVQDIIDEVKQQKKKMTKGQFEQMMVYLKGLEAKLMNPQRPTGRYCDYGELKKGDKVRITTEKDPPPGQGMDWPRKYDKHRGQITTVKRIDSDGDCWLETIENYFRPQWLEKVKQ